MVNANKTADSNGTTEGSKGNNNSSSKIGRVIDYLFGRNALIGLASFMLLLLSGYATWSGMNDFIVGSTASPAAEQGAGVLSISNSVMVISVVVALTFLMWLMLRETFAYGRRTRDRFLTFPVYLFLALWSIGFGYGFWWSLIAGEEATRTGLAGLQEDARDAGAVVSARLQAVKVQLDSVVQWSDGQMSREDTSGGSCGVPSGAGRGPLYNARRTVRDQIGSLRDSVTTSWLGPVETELETFKTVVSSLEGVTVEERQRSFEDLARNIRGSARNIAARSNQLGQSTASEMRALADAVSVEPGKPNFSCYDPALAQRLRAAADQAAEPAVLKLREAAFSEGAAGVANAVKKLWSNIGSYLSFGLTDDGSASNGESLTGRDVIAFLATVGIDLGLFVLTALNPPQTPPTRELPGSLQRQIVNAIKTAIKRSEDANWEWVRQHFIYHKNFSYFVIPNIHSSDPSQPGEEKRALAMNQLAGVLDDLDLVEVLNDGELKRLGREEQRESYTDLTPYRQQWYQQDSVKDEKKEVRQRKRNHGLFSKAERALQIAQWSDKARMDVEVFKLVDREGLTPLLAVLNDPGEGMDPYEEGLNEQVGIVEAKTQYVVGLLEGSKLNVADVSVIFRIEKGGNVISSALEKIYTTWPVIRNHVHKHGRTNANAIQYASEAVINSWVADPKRSFPASKMPRTDLKNSVATYAILPLVRDDLQRIVGNGNDESGKQSTDAINNAIKSIDAFLDPASQMSADDLAIALEKASGDGEVKA